MLADRKFCIVASSRSTGDSGTSTFEANWLNCASVPTTEISSDGISTIDAPGALYRWLPAQHRHHRHPVAQAEIQLPETPPDERAVGRNRHLSHMQELGAVVPGRHDGARIFFVQVGKETLFETQVSSLIRLQNSANSNSRMANAINAPQRYELR